MQKRRIDDELVKKTVADIGGRLGEGLQHSSGLSETVGQQLIEHGSSIANKVRTIHARSDVSKLISDESVLYLSENKKRTREWFQARDNVVPLGGTKFGVIRSIAYSDMNVNPSAGISSEAGEETKFSLKDSEAFKKWFGDSKVVDKKGDPLVVYHATDSEFNVFDRSKLGDFTSGNTDWRPAVRSAQIGFWFSDRDLAATIFTDPDKTKAV